MENLFQPILENNRSRLEPLEWSHFEQLLPVILASPDLDKYSPSSFSDEQSLKTYFHQAFDAKQQGKRYPFAIFDKQTGKFAGSSSFGNPSVKDKRLEIGWTWIGKEWQRTGLNRNNKFLMLQYAFEQLDFERVELKADGRNLQSRKGMEGIGATYEGALRSHTVMHDGFRRDTVYYSILKNEWEEVKASRFKGFQTS